MNWSLYYNYIPSYHHQIGHKSLMLVFRYYRLDHDECRSPLYVSEITPLFGLYLDMSLMLTV